MGEGVHRRHMDSTTTRRKTDTQKLGVEGRFWIVEDEYARHVQQGLDKLKRDGIIV